MWLIIIFILGIAALNLLKQELKKGDLKTKRNRNKLNKDYESERKLNILKGQNNVWQKEYSQMQKYAQKAREYEKENYLKALEYHIKAYEYGHNSSILTINNYSHSIDRAIVNFGKLKKTKELKEFLQKVIEQYPNELSTQNWIVRLSKLNSKVSISKVKMQSKIPKKDELISIDETLGEKINALKKQFPEFDFYSKKPDDLGTLEYLRLYNIIPKGLLSDYKMTIRKIELILNKAKVYENSGDYNSAIFIYTKLINQNIEDKKPYDRLMIIYRQLKETEKEINIIKKGINFFESLQKRNLEYVMKLAKENKKIDFAQNYINSGKRIQYYGGTFDLYNPYTFTDKWKDRLIKLKEQTKNPKNK